MSYGELKIDTITFTSAGVDTSVSVSGLVQNPTFTGNITTTGTISGDIIRGNEISGVTITGDTGNFTSGIFSTGTAAAPSIVFDGDPDTGFFSASITGTTSQHVSYALSGVEVLRLTSDIGDNRIQFNNFSARVSEQVLIEDTGSTVVTIVGNNANGAAEGGAYLGLARAGSSALNSYAALLSGNVLGKIQFRAANGVGNLYAGASIEARADRNTGNSSTPGNLAFFTTASGSVTPTERMHINCSGLVGVGTSSPANLLHVESSFSGTLVKIKNNAGSTAADTALEIESSTTAAKTLLVKNAGTDRFWVQGNGTAYFNGSVGIGTTSPSGTLDVETATDTYFNVSTTSATSGAGVSILSNANEGFVGYQNALRFATVTGKNAAGFNERARLDSSGRLLVGTSSSPSAGDGQYSLQVIQGYVGVPTGQGLMSLQRGETASNITSNETIGVISFNDSDGYVFGQIYCQADANAGASDFPGRLVFSTTADSASSPTERMRISANGFINASNDGGYFSTGYNAHTFTTSQNNWSTVLHNKNASASYGALFEFNTDHNNTASYFWQGRGAANNRATLYANGGLANYQSNNVNLCDEREKKNIEALDSTWGCLKNWDLKKFHYNEDADTDDKRYGVIAQQVAPHCPEVISDWVKQKAEDAVLDEDGNVVTPAKEEITRMAVKEQQMMWMAIKALQEAQLRIEELEAKVAALEAS
jgi:hypothetical protein